MTNASRRRILGHALRRIGTRTPEMQQSRELFKEMAVQVPCDNAVRRTVSMMWVCVVDPIVATSSQRKNASEVGGGSVSASLPSPAVFASGGQSALLMGMM